LWIAAGRSWLARLQLVLALQLAGLSLFIQGLGMTAIRSVSVLNHQRSAALMALPERQLLTTEAWLAAIAPQVYLTKEVFLVDGPQPAREWLRRAGMGGVRVFVLVSASEASVLGAESSGLSVLAHYRMEDDFLYVTRYQIDAPP
jgi:hypothetical protein